jgi:hypothetical protein
MSFPFGPSALTLSGLAKQLRTTFQTLTDKWRGKDTRYTIEDAGLSAFSLFFMQSPSSLEYPRTLQEMHGKNNAQTLLEGVPHLDGQSPSRFAGCRGGVSGLSYIFRNYSGIPCGTIDYG